MNIYSKKVTFSLSIGIFVVLLIILIVAIIIYCLIDNPGNLWGAFFGSLSAGLLVAILQFVISWQTYSEMEKLKKLKLIEILYNRADRNKYADYIRNCNSELDVMGVTAVRFFNDFADMSNGAPEEATLLLKILKRGVGVRILLPSKEYLPSSKKVDFDRVSEKYNELKQIGKIEIRYFNHNAAHSIFRVDDTCIIGPVFPELESKNTPALHVMRASPWASNYMKYFEKEWCIANPI